jgi:hypothetical protein
MHSQFDSTLKRMHCRAPSMPIRRSSHTRHGDSTATSESRGIARWGEIGARRHDVTRDETGGSSSRRKRNGTPEGGEQKRPFVSVPKHLVILAAFLQLGRARGHPALRMTTGRHHAVPIGAALQP